MSKKVFFPILKILSFTIMAAFFLFCPYIMFLNFVCSRATGHIFCTKNQICLFDETLGHE